MQSDQELMLAYRAGDRAAFDELFARYRDPVWRFFRRRVADTARAEELAQETFLALIQSAPRYEPRAAFRSYVFGVAYNVLLAARRRRRRGIEEPIAELDPPGASSDPASVLWIRQAMAALDPGEREVLMLREYEALSYDEIASLTGVPVGTVRSRLFRAREALRAKLAGREAQEVPR
ncbi:MAG: sigma-70 family RNA polymerase sigma factor [Vicinamibacterales bacterium]